MLVFVDDNLSADKSWYQNLIAFRNEDYVEIKKDQHLPDRLSKFPNQIMNEAKLRKQEEQKKEQDTKTKDDEKRKKRTEDLKQELKKLND